MRGNRDEKVTTTEIILRVVGAVGLLSVALVAPNAMQILKLFGKKQRLYNPKYYLNEQTKKLIDKGLLMEIEENNTRKVRLTKKGKVVLNKYLIKQKKGKHNKWDGKWRVLMFDVWETNRSKRDLLRDEIKDYGFTQLQQSVWVYPFDCGEFIELLKSELHFGQNVRYMVVDSLDPDYKLRKHFKLS